MVFVRKPSCSWQAKPRLAVGEDERTLLLPLDPHHSLRMNSDEVSGAGSF